MAVVTPSELGVDPKLLIVNTAGAGAEEPSRQ